MLFLLVGLLVLATPASAGTLSWSAEVIPGTAGMLLGSAGVDVRDIAVAADGTTLYVVPGDSVSDNVVYESNDAGVSWLVWDVAIEADLVAVAPDDANMVAIASSSTPAVYVTTNGGSTWYSLGAPQQSGGTVAAAIYDVAISAVSGGVRYIAVAGEEAGNVANVWYYRFGSTVSVWKETNNLSGFGNANLVKAVAFSPDFPADRVMVAVSEKDNEYVKFEILSLSTEKWNTSAGFTDYPVAIVSDDGITDLTSASISLTPQYMGSESDKRIAFVGLTVSGDSAASATSGIYRLDNISRKLLKTGVNIHSLAFNGTSLVAGAHDSNIVYRSTDPLGATPTFSDTSSLKRPGGEDRTVVAWTGSNVVAGTSGNESAFAISRDSGKSFNDTSIIDTVITNARDVAVSADGGTVYLVSDDGADFSLWRRGSSWERVLSVKGTAGDGWIVRIAPGSVNSVYVARKNSTTIYYSRDGGRVEWLTRGCTINVEDLAVESGGIAYVLNDAGSVVRSGDAGFTWGTTRATGLDSGATIVGVGKDNLLAGSQNGYVAYSTDGNSSWTDIEKVLESGAGRVQVVADENFAGNKVIYAASDNTRRNIKKWTIGASTAWSDIFRDTVPGGIYGLAVDGGILYALEFNPTTNQSILWQCLSPTTATRLSSSWSSTATTSTTDEDDATVRLNAVPRALKASTNKLWAVKTNGISKLYSFTTILTGLILRTPAPGFVNPVNTITGTANEIIFRWERLSKATEYQLDIAYDEKFSGIITTITKESDEATIYVRVGPDRAGDARVNFAAGTRYYWRIRVTQPLYSRYSATRNFGIEPLVMPESGGLLVPTNSSTGISRFPSFSWWPVAGATEYRFVLADSVGLASPIIDVRVKDAGFAVTGELDYGKTYYWAVKPVAPVESGWSALANFTVEEKPITTTVLPPVIIQQAPPAEIHLEWPPLSPPEIVILPPSSATLPSPTTPAYIWGIIIIGTILMITIIFWTDRVAEAYSGQVKRIKGDSVKVFPKSQENQNRRGL